MRVTFIPGHAGRTVNVILPGWVFNLIIGTVVAAVVMLVGGVVVSARMGLELRGLRALRYENEILRRENQKVRQLEAELSQLDLLRERVLALANEETGLGLKGRPKTVRIPTDPAVLGRDRATSRLQSGVGEGARPGDPRAGNDRAGTRGAAGTAGEDRLAARETDLLSRRADDVEPGSPFAGPYRPAEDGASGAGQSNASTTGWRWPVKGVISKSFSRSSVPGKEHHGLDIAAAHGTPVLAARSGQIVFAGKDSVFGQMVLIDHGGNLQSLYGHNSTLRVGIGDRVVAGQEIARVGSTGESSAPHLHFEIRSGGQAIDPRRHLP